MIVAAVSGGRSDFGLLRPTLQALHAADQFELRLVVTAMHLDPRFGETLDEIENAGLPVYAQVPVTAEDHAGRISEALLKLHDVLAGADLLLILGDRYEALAAALAATALGIPIAHLHGGELSEGSLDDAMRHCITKLAHLHFPAARPYAERIVQLGEDPTRVHVVGAAGLEAIRDLELLSRTELATELGHPLDAPLVAVTVHPESLVPDDGAALGAAVCTAVEAALGDAGSAVITLPNDDPGNEAVRAAMLAFADGRPNVHVHVALGHLRYLSLLRHADAIVGNSSSALLEAPAFHVPVVDVGDRQRGRIKPANVIEAAADPVAVTDSLRRALEPGFRAGLAGMENPYGDGDVSRRVIAALAAAPPTAELRRKHFFDLPDGPWRGAVG